ncbi:DUF1183-domain-containing protein [Aaosphaeria arxii CBS 175.79]|uniref:Store-operated calcium entry-associated regulatory factor n=1 Tax=Aaosphaeria arxii CBS 175.79 TaxID=1450172 RepID=A0A6A5XKE5_9PLEO|nr:DUF1183-domain-containing protein [Aaosphaeria arxii CBS 175.79]KAF2012774.1 DUF1183-domain-containing protein [Aaosphaeria arxii CBS 175.79]
MHHLSFLYPALLATSALVEGVHGLRSGNKVKLSNVQSLTLRKDMKTSHRRVSAIPQLNCIGGSGRGLYEIDVMRCKNAGSDYNEEDIQWTCTASLPEEFKLGSTDVICEGYDYPEDPYILKGSCGVEYKLVLTDKGHEKYGHKKPWFGGGDDDGKHQQTTGDKISVALFWVVFVGVALWIVYSAFIGWARGAERPAWNGGNNRPGWGGGGGGNGGDDDDPPPPYDWRPSPNNPKRGYGATDGWRPGFWSGALGGAAAGYAAGRSGNRGNQTNSGWGFGGGRGGSSWNNGGEGSSRSTSSSPSYSSTRHESTGFGSTSRR